MDYIQLLNGERFRKDELLELMLDDKFYYGYLGKAALSSSSIKLLLDSPKKYKYVMEYGSQESNALDAGWLFHTCILEPDVFNSQVFVDVQSKNTKASFAPCFPSSKMLSSRCSKCVFLLIHLL